jgi:uracil-DNA glycosylase
MENEHLNLREIIQNDWKNIIEICFKEDSMLQLENDLRAEYDNFQVFPAYQDIFRALQLTDFLDVSVVIIGQDPYHGLDEAHGLSFSVPQGIKIPPSLRNIFKELQADIGVERTKSDLSDWASQGVLLLNSVLSVRADQPGSHAKIGWQKFTSFVLQALNEREKPLVFMLWGNYAQKLGKQLDETKHLVIRCAHPSPLAANRGAWFGSKPFSRANAFLTSRALKPIKWA